MTELKTLKCIHIDNDICYCACPKCNIECTIEKQKEKGLIKEEDLE